MNNSPISRLVATGEYSQLVAITIPPATDAGEEEVRNSDRVIFIAEGAVEAIVNGQVERAEEHDAIFVPAGSIYSLKNRGSRDLKLFVSYSPPASPDSRLEPYGSGRTSFHAIAQSASLAETNRNVPQTFPSGIKWASSQTPSLRNVLFATDFSPGSEAALPYAISIVRHYGSNLHVAHVINPETYGLMAPQVIDQIVSQVKEAARSNIEKLIRSEYGLEGRYEATVAVGAVADALLNLVATKGIDLVVLGTHGRRGLRKLVLGSVAEEMFRLAACPVLTVGPKASGVRPESLQLKQIVYPMELTSNLVKTASYAVSIAKEYGSQLTFVNVIEEPSMSGDERAWINAAALHWFEDKVAPELELGEKIQFVQKFGDPAAAILRCAEEVSADLIVMNVHGSHPILAGRAPSVAHHVVAEAYCPVLTVR
ncbi:MAG TPA: universal stress protein [Terriglobales bacterium]|nr:universal stress protein [Terriglobales bacterium]